MKPIKVRGFGCNPKKAAQMMPNPVESGNLPAHLLVGSEAIRPVGEKPGALKQEFETRHSLTASTGLD